MDGLGHSSMRRVPWKMACMHPTSMGMNMYIEGLEGMAIKCTWAWRPIKHKVSMLACIAWAHEEARRKGASHGKRGLTLSP